MSKVDKLQSLPPVGIEFQFGFLILIVDTIHKNLYLPRAHCME